LKIKGDLKLRKLISFTIDEEVIQTLRNHTEKTDVPASRLIERLLKDFFKTKKRKKKVG